MSEVETNLANAIGHEIQTGSRVPNAVDDHNGLVGRNRHDGTC